MKRQARSVAVWRRARAWGMNWQVVKTSLAAGASWALASAIMQSARPYLAPMAAILCLQITVKASLSRGLQRTFGVAIGIVVAAVLGRVLGVSAWSIVALVFASLVVATRLGLGPLGIPQVAVTSLLILALGDHPGYMMARIGDTVIGALVAILVNALVMPADFSREAATAVSELRSRIQTTLGRIAQVLETPTVAHASAVWDEAREVRKALERASSQLDRAEEGAQWNYLGRAQRVRIGRLQEALGALERAEIQVRGIARTLVLASQHAVPQEGYANYADLFHAMARALDEYQAILDQDQGQPHAMRLDGLFVKIAEEHRQITDRYLGAILVDLEKMGEDLRASAAVLSSFHPARASSP